ncbi:hypothetical protein MMC10_007859 [Thelotrema lepadinum]|nr:hypothetical protein [Thelotrema lepadinum]
MATISVWMVANVAIALLIFYRLAVIIHRLFIHPLCKIPGPWLHSASNLPLLYQRTYKGTWTRSAAFYHAHYGPIVRISPNVLSVDGPLAWPDIFSHRPGKAEWARHPMQFDEYYAQTFLAADTSEHKRYRRIFAPAFTEKAVRAQEPVLQNHTTVLLDQLSKRQNQPLDLNKWLAYTTFDITAELNLGESFHGLEKDETHFWVAVIFDSLRLSSMTRVFRQYPLLQTILPLLMTKKMTAKMRAHTDIVRDRVDRRIQLGTDAKQDFMTHFMGHMEKGALTQKQVEGNGGLFIVAGSETSAAALSTVLYYLGKENGVYIELTREIREAFESEEEITVAATQRLVYMTLCLKEALRIHSPVPELLSRRSPGDWVGGYWVPEGTEVAVSTYATFLSSKYFHQPQSFRPQRHAGRDSPYYDPVFANDNRAAFEPFATGPRDCIGRHLGWAQIRLVLAKLLWRFDVEVDWSVSEGWLERPRVWQIWEKSERVGGLMGRVREREGLGARSGVGAGEKEEELVI